MEAKELVKRYAMGAHIENGMFIERHYEHTGTERADSGLIYYYVAPGECTEFHVIDCDEYWCYACGVPIEVWQIDVNGRLTVSRLGIDEGCEPVLYLRKGVIFASKLDKSAVDGTFLSCITVPRFTYEGFRMLTKEDVTEICPEAESFFASEKTGE